MDAVTARIKGYVLVIDSSIPNDATLSFYVEDVKDRALVYMNRQSLVKGYEEYLLGNYYYTANYYVDIAGDYQPVLPIPLEVERALAKVIVNSYRTATAQVAQQKDIKSLEDNGQSVTYSGVLASYFASVSDKELFGDIKTLLDKFRLARVVH